jgi:hypothetical protein
MSIDQTRTVDFITFDRKSGDVWLTVSDHLPWDQEEGKHLLLLQEKLNAYLEFIEGGQIFTECPDAEGRNIVIDVVGVYPLSQQAKRFYELATTATRDAGFNLQFRLRHSI